MRVTKFSRRQFFQRVGITAGGAALAAIALESACKSSDSSSPETTNTPVTSNPTSTGYHYLPPKTQPPFISVPESGCVIATDRLYSPEHIWVKSVSTDLVVLGISNPLVKILYEPYSLSLPEVGQSLARDDAFGSIEGYKMRVDLLSPVTGVIIEVNEDVREQGRGGLAGYIALVNGDPYNYGWMIVVQMKKQMSLMIS